MDSGDRKAAPGEDRARPSWRKRLRSVQRYVPAFAVVVVVATALLATLMVTRSERAADRVSAVTLATRPDGLGAGRACGNCGVVESVEPGGSGAYRLHIRMDDGTMRTVEQRVAPAAGMRVVLEGGSARAMRAP